MEWFRKEIANFVTLYLIFYFQAFEKHIAPSMTCADIVVPRGIY
jgi:hypothetical protein